MRELSVAEQRYKAVLAVISDGRTITEVAAAVGVSRQTLHGWLARYEAEGLDGLVDRSHRPLSCRHQMPVAMEVLVLELRRQHRGWGPKRIAAEIARRDAADAPPASGVYRSLQRSGLIGPDA
jgi:transposase